MPALLLTPPAADPLSLEDAKFFLRVDHDADDVLIGSLIAAARREVEIATRRVLVTQSWRIVLHRWPAARRVVSPLNPLGTLVAARVFDAEGEAQALDPGQFRLDTASVPGLIDFSGANVPAPGRVLAGIELDVTAGYGDPEDVPAPLLQAIRLLLARAYEHRDAMAHDALPDAVAALVAPFRVIAL